MQPPQQPNNPIPPQGTPQSQPPYQPPTSAGQEFPTQPSTEYPSYAAPTWGQQPPAPPTPPTAPQPYRHGGRVLAVLAAITFLGWWFAFTGYIGNEAIFTLAVVVLTLLPLALFAIDWSGYTSLMGLVRWQRLSTGNKFAVGCLFFFLWAVMPVVYLFRAIQQHYQATRQSPAQQVQQLFKTLPQRTQQEQVFIVKGSLVAAIVFCTMTGVAVGGGHPPSSNAGITAAATSTPQASDSGPSGSGVGVLAPTATPSPTATPKPKPTATPKPKPTATPKPKPTCIPGAVNCNPWGYNFSHGSYIYNPPGAFCSYFACIANFWNGKGYVMQCQDGMYSKSGGRSGSCSYHGGNRRPLLKP
jgi:hypothetical protein